VCHFEKTFSCAAFPLAACTHPLHEGFVL
jgi:hypothetical protein